MSRTRRKRRARKTRRKRNQRGGETRRKKEEKRERKEEEKHRERKEEEKHRERKEEEEEEKDEHCKSGKNGCWRVMMRDTARRATSGTYVMRVLVRECKNPQN